LLETCKGLVYCEERQERNEKVSHSMNDNSERAKWKTTTQKARKKEKTAVKKDIKANRK
jgi:hypothetical protein